MSKIEIKSRSGKILFAGEYDSIKAAVAAAVAKKAHLSWAHLSGADLSGADLSGNSHDFTAEILRRAAGEDVKKLMLAGLPLVTRHWCKDEYKEVLSKLSKSLAAWAIKALTAEDNWGFGWLKE